MKQTLQSHVIGELEQACARHPAHHLAPTFLEQGEFVTLHATLCRKALSSSLWKRWNEFGPD